MTPCSSSQDGTLLSAWTARHILGTLQNLIALGGGVARAAVRDATNDELRRILPVIEKEVKVHIGDMVAKYVEDCNRTILS
jgi:hypothetical protein